MTSSVRRAVRLEHRLTQPNASLADLEAAVELAIRHDIAAITVNPWLVKGAKRALGGSRVALGTVVGYPHGTHVLSVKAFEASRALEQGATEIDFVLNGGALASGDDEAVVNDMLAVIDMAHSALAAVGVIIEAEPMSEELVRRACRLAERAGADHLVTSPGGATARGTVARTRLLRDSVGPRLGIKACGRFRNAEQLGAAGAAGATRLSVVFTAGLARQAAEAPQLAGSAS